MATRSKLAVILHADVVGSTALVRKDERLAHERIREAFQQFSETIQRYGGRAREVRGDALVAEFSKASAAVSAALSFQDDNATLNPESRDGLHPVIRVGIAMGEVVVADDTVTGEGVVLAQRLEQLAEPGGICLQGACYETVPKRLPFEYENLGEKDFKGFDEPVSAYRVSLMPGVSAPEPERRAGTRLPRRPALFGATVAALIGISVLAWQWKLPERLVEPASVDRMKFPLPDRPSVAVLPFTNMSGDPEQEYFVDGMAEDLITDLSKLPGLFVIARNSSFTYKGQAVKVRQVAEELGVRYVVEGSVRRADGQVRINAQLIDATTGHHVWADRYDRSLTRVFELQDEVTRQIVAALSLAVLPDDGGRHPRRETGSLVAYDAFLEGWARYRRQTPEDFRKAIDHFKRAIELDPDYQMPHVALASLYLDGWRNWWLVGLGVGPVNALKWAKHHLDAASGNPTAMYYRGASLMHLVNALRNREDHYEEAIADAERAIDANPNDPIGYEAMATALIMSGRPEESITFSETAQRLDPWGNQLLLIGQAEFLMGNYERAVTTLERFTRRNESKHHAFVYLMAANGYLGRVKDARSAYNGLQASFRMNGERSGRSWRLGRIDEGGDYTEEQARALRRGMLLTGLFDDQPEVVEASEDGITLRRTPWVSSAQVIYRFASEHCSKHGKKSSVASSSPPTYVFGCH